MLVLLFEDKLGITAGYESHWQSILLKANMLGATVVRRKLWTSPVAKKHRLMIRKGNRLSPGFNPDMFVQNDIGEWVMAQLKRVKPDLVIIQDLALLGLLEKSWDIATIDNLRGGVHNLLGFMTLVTVPVSAINKKPQVKDIRLLNSGAADEAEWDDGTHEEEDFYIPPYTIPLGEWVLLADMRKALRLLKRGIPARNDYDIRVVRSPREAKLATEFLMEASIIAEDVETNPADMLLTVNGMTGLLESGEKRTYVYPLLRARNSASGPIDCFESSLASMRKVNKSGIPITFHNGSYDLFWLNRYRMSVKNYAYDSMTMFWALLPELPKNLAFVSSIMLDDYRYWKGDRKSDDYETYLRYNGLDCDRTLGNTLKLVELLKVNAAARLNFVNAHRRVTICIGMSMRGMNVDDGIKEEIRTELTAQAESAKMHLQYLVADDDFNFRSVKQKKHLLYELLGATKLTAKGKPTKRLDKASSGKIPLSIIKRHNPVYRRIVTGIEKAMVPAMQISNIIEVKMPPWNRAYTSYGGTGTTTTRLNSSSTPINVGTNMQNWRKSYRHWIVAEPKGILIEVDYSAADDVYISAESADPNKLELLTSGRDAHAHNCTIVFPHWTYEAVLAGKTARDPKVIHPITGIRQIMKKISHGSNYLMAAMTLYMTAGRDPIVAAAIELGNPEAGTWSQQRLIDFCGTLANSYRNHYKRLLLPGNAGSWYDELTQIVVDTGGYTTPHRYFQRFLGDPHSHDTLRAIAATVGQAGTAGRINAAMDEIIFGYIDPHFRDAPNPAAKDPDICKVDLDEHGISLRLQTHDSLTFNGFPEHPGFSEGLRRIDKAMNRPVYIRNSLTNELMEIFVKTEMEVGFGWGKALHEVPELTMGAIESVLDRKLWLP